MGGPKGSKDGGDLELKWRVVEGEGEEGQGHRAMRAQQHEADGLRVRRTDLSFHCLTESRDARQKGVIKTGRLDSREGYRSPRRKTLAATRRTRFR